MSDFLNRLHRGDCIAGLNALPEACVDLAFADPPFNIGYEYDTYDDRRQCDDYLSWCTDWTDAVLRVLKPNGTFWLAIGDEYAAELKVMLTRQRKQPLHLRSWVIWYYTFGVNCKQKFSRSHAHLFYFVKNANAFTFNHDDPAVRVPSARQLVYADKRANPRGRLPDDTWITPPPSAEFADATHDGWYLRPQDVLNGFTEDGDVWYFPRVNGTFKERAGWHGCQMPERLLGRIVRFCSNAGDVVLDPFAGSGTTLAVAKKLGRQWVGYELSTEYAERVEQRLAKIEPGEPLDGVENPLRSVPATARGRRRK